LLPDLTLRLGYTKFTGYDLSHQEEVGRLPLQRRTDYKVTAETGYKWKNMSLQITAQHIGPRFDKDLNGDWVTLEPYTLVNARVAFALTPELELYTKIQNLLNADYTEVFGYSTSRFAAMGGLKYNWQ
jgi:vitamin B12 transporter